MAKSTEFRRRLIYTDGPGLRFCLLRMPGVLVAVNQLAESWQTLELGTLDKEKFLQLNTGQIDLFREQFYKKNLAGQPTALVNVLQKEVNKIWTTFENSVRFFKDQFNQITYSLVYDVRLDLDLVEFDETGKAYFPDSVHDQLKELYQFYIETPIEAEVFERCQTILENLSDLKQFLDQNGFDIESPLCSIIGVNGLIAEQQQNEFFLNGAILPTWRRFRAARMKALAV